MWLRAPHRLAPYTMRVYVFALPVKTASSLLDAFQFARLLLRFVELVDSGYSMFLSFASGQRADLLLAVSHATDPLSSVILCIHRGLLVRRVREYRSLNSQETIASRDVHGEARDFAVFDEGEHALCGATTSFPHSRYCLWYCIRKS